MAYSQEAQKIGAVSGRATRTPAEIDQGLRNHMRGVFNWMSAGLAVSGLTAYLIMTQPVLMDLFYYTVQKDDGDTDLKFTLLAYLALILPFALILLLGAKLDTMRPATAQKMLIGLCACMGVIMAPLATEYTTASLAQTFFVTAGTFAAMSIYGYTTNADLSRLGNMLMMALIGLIIANLASSFTGGSGSNLALSMFGVLTFVGFTAYDSQRMKVQYLDRAGSLGDEMEQKLAVLDALALYLNFLNLFLYMLRFLGIKTKD